MLEILVGPDERRENPLRRKLPNPTSNTSLFLFSQLEMHFCHSVHPAAHRSKHALGDLESSLLQ